MLTIGIKLGPYEIVGAIGAGGMLSRLVGASETGVGRRNPPEAEARTKTGADPRR